MAVNKPTGDNARRGAVKKRSQLKTKVMGEETWSKRSRASGKFIAQKKAPAKKALQRRAQGKGALGINGVSNSPPTSANVV